MTTITQKKKLSKSAWILVLLLLVAVIAVAILALIGFIDLTPVSNIVLSIYTWASADIVNAAIISITLPLGGVLLYWTIQRYFVGQKVTVAQGANAGYAPAPSYPTTPTQSGSETKIS